MCTVCFGLFTFPLDVIGRICSLTEGLSGHIVFASLIHFSLGPKKGNWQTVQWQNAVYNKNQNQNILLVTLANDCKKGKRKVRGVPQLH